MRLGEPMIAVLMLASCLGAQENKSTRLSPPGTAELTLNEKKSPLHTAGRKFMILKLVSNERVF